MGFLSAIRSAISAKPGCAAKRLLSVREGARELYQLRYLKQWDQDVIWACYAVVYADGSPEEWLNAIRLDQEPPATWVVHVQGSTDRYRFRSLLVAGGDDLHTVCIRFPRRPDSAAPSEQGGLKEDRRDKRGGHLDF